MADSDDLWTAVKARYSTSVLLQLTRRGDKTVTSIDDTLGVAASQAVISLWPAYAQVAYDSSNTLHVEAGVRGTVAQLFQWGGTAADVARIEWDEVFGPGGIIEKIRETDPRGHAGPSTNSGVRQSSELQSGRPVMGWADRDALPHGLLPRRRLAD